MNADKTGAFFVIAREMFVGPPSFSAVFVRCPVFLSVVPCRHFFHTPYGMRSFSAGGIFFAKNVRQRKKRPKVAGSDTRPL